MPTSALSPSTSTWSDRWSMLRDRVLSNSSFQRWASRFPLTRGVARRRAGALFDLCAGFVYSQVLFAAVEVGLIDALASGPQSLEALGRVIDLPPDALVRLVDAAAALDLVEHRRGRRIGLGIHGAALLGNPGLRDMITHHAMFYRDLDDPVALLRGDKPTELRDFWGYTGSERPGDETAERYSTLMARSLSLLAEDVIEAYPFAQHRQLLDVGGGEGAFVEAVAASCPTLQVGVFDLPAVAARARTRLEPLNDRAVVTGGDVFADALPTGADVATLVRILHDHDDERVRQILAAVFAALGPDGTLVVAEPLAGAPGAARMGHAYFGLYLLAMGQGRPRTASELCEMLIAVGFDRVRVIPTRRPLLASVVTGRVPMRFKRVSA